MKTWLTLIRDVYQTLKAEKQSLYLPLALLIIVLALVFAISVAMGPLTPFVYSLV